MDTQNEVGVMFLYVFWSAAIHFPMSHWAELADTQSMQANDERYSDRSNKSDLRKDVMI